MSAIIISAILLTVIITSSLTGFNSRFNVLDLESKRRSAALAQACIDTLILKLLTGSTVTTGPVTVDDEECEIMTTASPYHVQSVFNHAYTNLSVEVDPDTYEITSWKEVEIF